MLTIILQTTIHYFKFGNKKNQLFLKTTIPVPFGRLSCLLKWGIILTFFFPNYKNS